MASRYPSEWLDELTARADIVQVISGYVPLKKNGRKFWGLCPFHHEKTASFSVDPEKQMYYCFGCKAGGGVLRFLMDAERLSFQEAVRHLADQLHVPVPELENDPDWERRRSQRERLLEANREAARFYHSLLFTPQGEQALQYLKGRGLDDAVIRRFGLGAAPDSWDSLTRHLRDEGYTLDELRLAGLTVVRQQEGGGAHAFDMFRNRAMFPIIDQYGNVLAFGGRILGPGQPKYLNTSDTPVFNKRLGVYAANLLRKERGLSRVVLVEGYMDVVSLTQFGVRGVCATLGTALTPEQAQYLKRFAPEVYLAYDGDGAGQHAILRGLDILSAEGVPARVLDFPDGLDPDEFIRRDGAEAFAGLPALAPETYRLRRLKDGFDLTSQEGRTAYAKEAAKILRGLEPVELENRLQELMVQTGFPREVLLAQIRETPAPAVRPQPDIRVRPVPQTAESVPDEEMLLSVLSSGRIEMNIVSEKDFSDPFLKELYTRIKDGRSARVVVDELTDDAERARASRILTMATADSTDELISMAGECIDKIRLRRLEARIDQRKAQLNGLNGEEKAAALRELNELMAEQRRLRLPRRV